MISFENVEKSDVKYEILYPYIRIAHNFFFYRHYYVLNEDNIPKDKPLVVICNHQNGLSDALGILFSFHKDGRRPVFIARADIFKKDFIAKLLRFLRIMPAYRAVDIGREKVGQNTKIFSKAGKIVADNGVISLFPEAGHEDCHHLGTFKGGFARVAFAAAEELNFEKPVYILPCSNHYSDYFGFHHKLIITVGQPFSFEDLYDIYKEYPEKARKILVQRSREHVKPLMLVIEDKVLYEEYDILRTLYAPILVKKQKQKVSYYPNILKAEQQVVTSLDQLKINQEEQYQEMMKEANLYAKYLNKLQIFDWVLAENLTFGNFLLRLLYAVLLIPVMLFGFVVNFVPYNASTLVTRKIKDPMLHN
ncbi:MAG: 1-acyl-sn-glycerol-3-phosphate acyltransferase, partial [Bacteroidales bacterium]|nr:1-acyl-sn-glycerol-3-phosphate acyltransferase [Bacteroidales bacterium]